MAHLGIIFGSCRLLLLDIVSEAIFDSIREPFGAEVDNKNQRKTREGCRKSAFSQLRFGVGFGGLSGAVLGLIWCPKLG